MKNSKVVARYSGIVTPFKGDGRKLGYPTGNITVTAKANDGVYFGFADLNDFKDHPAIIFIGTPTTTGDTRRRLEAYLLDIPDRDYYGLKLTVKLTYFHRPNQTFNSIKNLSRAMKADEAAARNWFTSLQQDH